MTNTNKTVFTLDNNDISQTPTGELNGIKVTCMTTEETVICNSFETPKENLIAALAVLSLKLGKPLLLPNEED